MRGLTQQPPLTSVTSRNLLVVCRQQHGSVSHSNSTTTAPREPWAAGGPREEGSVMHDLLTFATSGFLLPPRNSLSGTPSPARTSRGPFSLFTALASSTLAPLRRPYAVSREPVRSASVFPPRQVTLKAASTRNFLLVPLARGNRQRKSASYAAAARQRRTSTRYACRRATRTPDSPALRATVCSRYPLPAINNPTSTLRQHGHQSLQCQVTLAGPRYPTACNLAHGRSSCLSPDLT